MSVICASSKNLRLNIREYLESYFTTVYVASDGKEGLHLYHKYHPDVLLLDINLPYLSGLEMAQEVRKTDNITKIIILTTHTEKEKLLMAIELKLTKYLIKPITPKLFKKTMILLSHELKQNPSTYVYLGENTLWDKHDEKLFIHNKKIILNNKEHRLLRLFILHHKAIIHYEDIMIQVWEDAFDKEISLNSIKNLVSHLRKKLPKGSIDTIYGQGYCLK